MALIIDRDIQQIVGAFGERRDRWHKPGGQTVRIDGDVQCNPLRNLTLRTQTWQLPDQFMLKYADVLHDERARAIEAVITEAHGRIPVIAGVGALTTRDSIALAKDAKALGATAGLLAPVSYTPLTEDEVFGHYVRVVAESELPIIIYDNPGTTHFRFTPELIARLAVVPGIVAAKNSALVAYDTPGHLATLRATVPLSFSVGYAVDWNCVEALISGADTWYSVLAGTLPKVCVRMYHCAKSGDVAQARHLNSAMTPVWALFQQYSSLRVVYAIAEYLSICRAEPPLPILPLPEAARHHVNDTLKSLPPEFLA